MSTTDILRGFRSLKAGCIHLRCPNCGRKVSNTKRAEWDAANAVVIETECPKCVTGGYSTVRYFDADGNEIAPEGA